MAKLFVNLAAKSARLKRIQDFTVEEIKLKQEDGHSIVTVMIVTGEFEDAKDAREIANNICLEYGLSLIDKPDKTIGEFVFKIPTQIENLRTQE